MGRDVAKKGAHMAGRMSQKAADISVRVAESIVRHVGPNSTAFGQHLNAGGQTRTAAAQVTIFTTHQYVALALQSASVGSH